MQGVPLHPLDHEPKLWIKTGMQAKVFHAIYNRTKCAKLLFFLE